jgi:ADP-ribosylglycohydrolase
MLVDPTEAAVFSTLATHPSPYAALSTFLLVSAGKYYLEHNSQNDMIVFLFAKLADKENVLRKLFAEDKYIMAFQAEKKVDYIDAAFIDIRAAMTKIQSMPEPKHINGNDIDYFNLIEGKEDCKRFYGNDVDTGLIGSSFNTFVCALFCLRWADNTTLWQNLRRVILFGGDVDTLAACVMPFVYVKMHGTVKDDLPEWIIKGVNRKNLSLLD